MSLPRAFVLLVIACLCGVSALPSVAADPGCAATDPIAGPVAFPHLRAAIGSGGAVTIVAFGSSSTQGVGASGAGRSYPARLEAVLRSRLPGRGVTVVNAGVGGDTVTHMAARLDRDVLRHRPALVIWQLGANDALRNMDVAAFRSEAAAVIARLRASGADILLMEPQHLPSEPPDGVWNRYIAAVRALAGELGLPMLLRSSVMREWAAAGAVPAGRLLGPDGLHMTDESYGCLAALIAEILVPTGET